MNTTLYATDTPGFGLRVGLGMIGIVLLCGASPSQPDAVAAQIRDMSAACAQVKGTVESGPTVDEVTLDQGIDLWVVDEAGFRCASAETLFAGTGGSQVTVYRADPATGHASQVFSNGAYGTTIERTVASSRIWLRVGGRLCGQTGDPSHAEMIACDRPLQWDAAAGQLVFAPLSETRAVAVPAPTPAAAREAAKRPDPIYVDSAIHNGSQVLVSEWQDGAVEIKYDGPRPGLPVERGALLFRGVKHGDRYSGTAYTFKAGCAPAPYAVDGARDRKRETIVLSGAPPRRSAGSCEIIGGKVQSANAKLVFDTRFYGDE